MAYGNRRIIRRLVKEILLTTINAKWIHPSLALRLLKANLGALEEKCKIAEFALRQPLREKTDAILASRPRILGISVSIWNHTATIELLDTLEEFWERQNSPQAARPIVVLGGPEVSHLPQNAEIFRFADYVICGEGEIAFRQLCEKILSEAGPHQKQTAEIPPEIPPEFPAQFIDAQPVSPAEIKSAYHLYTEEDLARKLIYVESSRGCPFSCEYCLSSVKHPGTSAQAITAKLPVREFAAEKFLAEMDLLINRGAKTFKFLDRTFNSNIKRAVQIIEFFLKKLKENKTFVVHFEIVPSILPQEFLEALSQFPPDSLRLEIGIQTLNPKVASLISRPSNPAKELENLRRLRKNTNAIIHADLIAGLPGEDLASFGRGFDLLWQTLSQPEPSSATLREKESKKFEIQLGILKLLPGASISRHNETYKMRYNPLPPYEIEETINMNADEISRIKNFARFWETIVNHGLLNIEDNKETFVRFMALSDSLFAHFGRNWGIDKFELKKIISCIW